MILVLMTLMSAAYLHLEEKGGLKKVLGFKKESATSDNEEYLLIK